MTPIAILARDLARPNRAQAAAMLDAEIAAWLALLDRLDAADWTVRTVCPKWDVGDIARHLLGQAEDIARPWLFPLRNRRARRSYPELPTLDGHMEVQADEHGHRDQSEVTEMFGRLWPKAARRMRRLPAPLRALSVTTGLDMMPKLTIGYLHDVIYTRDLWMHRDDVCQATGAALVLDAHDAAVVSQVIRDLDEVAWAGPPLLLELTGPAGGQWRLGGGAPIATVRADAVAFMRSLAGRDDSATIELITGDAHACTEAGDVRLPF